MLILALTMEMATQKLAVEYGRVFLRWPPVTAPYAYALANFISLSLPFSALLH